MSDPFLSPTHFPTKFKNAPVPQDVLKWLSTTPQVDVLRVHQHVYGHAFELDTPVVVVPIPADGLLPVGYRFTLPYSGLGHCEITLHMTQTAEECMQDIPPRFDYVVRCGPERVKKYMTHEFVTDTLGVQEGWV